MKKVTIGGDRLGTGGKRQVALHGYERSTHDLSYVWRSTMSAGTLVPFLVEVALPSDTHDIDLDAYVLTHPTIGPLFGSYKVQLDVFSVPVRLFQGKLHMNLNNVGRDMSAIKLPQLELRSPKIDFSRDVDNQQVNPSCLLAYLGIRGVGRQEDNDMDYVKRQFNAIPYLAYFDIFKNYYANKQETNAYIIDREPYAETNLLSANIEYNGIVQTLPNTLGDPVIVYQNIAGVKIQYITDNTDGEINPTSCEALMSINGATVIWVKLADIYGKVETNYGDGWIKFSNPKSMFGELIGIADTRYVREKQAYNAIPKLRAFPLENIDTMRADILQNVNNPSAYPVDQGSIEPYNWTLRTAYGPDAITFYSSALQNQQGLLVKTYQSDKFNNWINTEWIDGPNGVSAVTAVSTVGDSFTIDELNLKTKIYKMLNRIAISDGSYDTWLEVVYDEQQFGKAEMPVYEGGLIKELIFDEVISTASAQGEIGVEQPLGTLGGRGKLAGKHKGGKIVIKTKEVSYIIGIASLTPRVDYSQGNRWETNLKTMNDFHKPALDEIGFEDVITDEMAYFDTTADQNGNIQFYSAGKQPAWTNYMTNYNRVLGNFAIESQQMWMTLNRRYEQSSTNGIGDLTTYIDPAKFNHIFADTRRDAQNFWVQIGVDITARRKMSAKVMPNL